MYLPQLAHELLGHRKAVNLLSISPNHEFLMSGDDGSVIVWDLSTGRQRQAIDVAFHGPVLSGCWIYGNQDTRPTGIVFGCSNGMIHHHRWDAASLRFKFVSIELSSPEQEPIEGIAFDPHHQQLATATGGCAKVWRFDQDGTLVELHAIDRDDDSISSLFFAENGEQLILCYLDSHQVISFQRATWVENWRHALPKRIGWAVKASNTMTVSNLKTGVDVFNFPPTQLIESYDHPIIENIRLQVTALFNGEVVVAGSDDGKPRILNRAGGGGFDGTLPHGVGRVPAVTSSQSGAVAFIATGASDQPFSVKIWTIKHLGLENRVTRQSAHVAPSISARQLCLVVGICFLCQFLILRAPLASLSDSAQATVDIASVEAQEPSNADIQASDALVERVSAQTPAKADAPVAVVSKTLHIPREVATPTTRTLKVDAPPSNLGGVRSRLHSAVSETKDICTAE